MQCNYWKVPRSSRHAVPPITLSTTFKQNAPADFKKYEYGRSGNPTKDVLEEWLAALDGDKHAIILAFSGRLNLRKQGTQKVVFGDQITGFS